MLLGWGDSRAPQRRAVFQALRKGALMFYYMVPGRDGGRNPAWDAIGYDGPLGKLEGAPPKALTMTPVERTSGSSATWSSSAPGPAEEPPRGCWPAAGLDVIVVESGDYYDDQDFDGSEFKALTGYYMGAPNASHDQSVSLLAGVVSGGRDGRQLQHLVPHAG